MYLAQKPGFAATVSHAAFAALRATAQGLVGALDALHDAGAKARKAEELVRLSDEQLAARGLTRDQIPNAVFGKISA